MAFLTSRSLITVLSVAPKSYKYRMKSKIPAPYKLSDGSLVFIPAQKLYKTKSGRRQCNHCGTYYKIKSGSKRYCSATCANTAERRRRVERGRTLDVKAVFHYKNCVQCHKTFPRQTLNQVTCCQLCKDRLDYRIRKWKLVRPGIIIPKDLKLVRLAKAGPGTVDSPAYALVRGKRVLKRFDSYDKARRGRTAAQVALALAAPLGAAQALSAASDLVCDAVAWLTIAHVLNLDN